MPCDDAVSQLCYDGNARNALISPKRPGPSVGQRTKDSFGGAVNAAIRFDKLDSLLKASRRDFRKALDDAGILERKIIDLTASYPLPARNPVAAEVTIPI